MAAAATTLELIVPGYTYIYCATAHAPHGASLPYRLARIVPFQQRLRYPCPKSLERTDLAEDAMTRLCIFNRMCICEAGAASMRFIFVSTDGRRDAYRMRPAWLLTPMTLDEDGGDDPPCPASPMLQPEDEGGEFTGASVFTVMHDYVRLQGGRFYHVGLSLVPSTPVTIPLWMNEEKMGHLLHTLRSYASRKAEYDATLVIRPGADPRFQSVCVLRALTGTEGPRLKWLKPPHAEEEEEEENTDSRKRKHQLRPWV